MEKSVVTKKGNTKNVIWLIASLILLLSASCDIDKKMQEQEQDLIASFIQTNNITVEPTASGLYYIEKELGDGPMPVDLDSVTVQYKLSLLSGYVLDESDVNDPFGFVLGIGISIPGFEEGIKLMHQGGKADLIIPSKLAYGRAGFYPGIAPYTPLLFEIELLEVFSGPFRPL